MRQTGVHGADCVLLLLLVVVVVVVVSR